MPLPPSFGVEVRWPGMIGSLGIPELLFILVLALLIFGPKRLPEVGRTLGRALGEFRRATSDLKRSVEVEMSLDDEERPSRRGGPRGSVASRGAAPPVPEPGLAPPPEGDEAAADLAEAREASGAEPDPGGDRSVRSAPRAPHAIDPD